MPQHHTIPHTATCLSPPFNFSLSTREGAGATHQVTTRRFIFCVMLCVVMYANKATLCFTVFTTRCFIFCVLSRQAQTAWQVGLTHLPHVMAHKHSLSYTHAQPAPPPLPPSLSLSLFFSLSPSLILSLSHTHTNTYTPT